MKKKIVGVVLCLVLTGLIVASLSACDKKGGKKTEVQSLQVAVLSDIHLMTDEEVGDRTSYYYTYYTNRMQSMVFLSEAIYKSVIDQLIEQKPDVVLLSGDLTNTGSVASMQVVADGCEKLEKAGIKVFVTGGLNDFSQGVYKRGVYFQYIPRVSPESFAEMFADYGYNEAIARDDETLSYVVDLDETHRLLVLDTISTYDYSQSDFLDADVRTPEVSNALLCFIEEVLDEARDQRKEVLVMSYLPVNNAVGDYFGILTKNRMLALDKQEYIAEMFTEFGVRYAVSGRLHVQKCLALDNQYTTFYNYFSSALCCYPLEIMWLTSEEDRFIVEEKPLTKVKEEYLPDCLTAEERAGILADPVAFSERYVLENIWNVIQNSIDQEGKNGWFMRLLYKAGYYESTEIYNEAKPVAFCEKIYQGYLKLLDMPLYGEENSIESVCGAYEIELPSVPYATVKEFIAENIRYIYSDETRITAGTPESVVFRYIIYTALKMIAEMNIGQDLHEMNDAVVAFDLTVFTDSLFTEGIIDITTEDIGVQLFSVFEPLLQEKLGLKNKFFPSSGTEQYLEVIDTILPYALKILFPLEYDDEEKTIFGIRYEKYVDVKNGIFDLEKFLDDALLDIFARDILF